MAKVLALLDSGATENFIDKRTVATLGLGTRTLIQPLSIHNVDGTMNQEGQITQYCDLWVRKGKQNTKLRFYVTSLGRDRLILGHPWFRHFNPDIDWPTSSLKGNPVSIKTAGYQTKKRQQVKKLRTTNTIDPEIPAYYHRHAQVFDEQASHHFPPQRDEDHPITLKPDAPSSLNCKIYAQT